MWRRGGLGCKAREAWESRCIIYGAGGLSFPSARTSPSLPRLLLPRQHTPQCSRIATYDILAPWVR